MSIPQRVESRLIQGVKRFQPLIANAQARDVNESDTSIILMDVLQDVLGYDKYSEVTSEYKVKNSFCDLAIKIDGLLHMLIEVKSIGTDLKDTNIKQATDYAANDGCDWILLTNLINWRVYKIIFGKPIDHELVLDFNFLSLNSKDENHLEWLYCLSKEGRKKDALEELHDLQEATSRFTIGALLLTDPIVSVLRRELKRCVTDVKITSDQILAVLSEQVIKREILEDEKSKVASRRVERALKRSIRSKAKEVPKESIIEDPSQSAA